jgi:putative addiction module component (TIGR02574 family)
MTASFDPCYLLPMNETLNLDDVLKLPAVQRLRIAAAIWDSVADQPESLPLTEQQALELDARYADFLAHPDDGISWADAKAQLLSLR